jgi:hypothetical protein
VTGSDEVRRQMNLSLQRNYALGGMVGVEYCRSWALSLSLNAFWAQLFIGVAFLLVISAIIKKFGLGFSIFPFHVSKIEQNAYCMPHLIIPP